MTVQRLFYAVALLGVAVAAACGEAPTSPSRAGAGGAGVQADETNQGLTISCPYHSIEVAEAMYCTTTYYGTNVTASTNFYSMNTAVVTAGSGGYVDAVATGGTLVWASYNGITVSWDTQVFNLTVTLSTPVSYAYNQYVTWTATPSVAGSYHYTWEEKWCYNGSAPGDCDGLWHARSGGQDVTTKRSYVYNEDYYVGWRVTVRRSAGGPVLATDEHFVDGAGEGSGGGCNPFC
jgi:hypothetical protein